MTEDQLATLPMKAVVRAEPHRDTVEIIFILFDPAFDNSESEVEVMAITDPHRSFAERKAIATNLARRINRDVVRLCAIDDARSLGEEQEAT